MQPDDTAPTRRQRSADDSPTVEGPTVPVRPGQAERAAPPAANVPAAGDLTGQVLSGKYRVVRLLGKGGFGAVYEAKDEMLGASVAVKVLTPAAARQEDALQQFLGEARLLTSLDHPNVVRWITFDRTPQGLHYFVMEVLKGCELSDILEQEQRLPPERVTAMLLQVLSALRAAHFLPDGRSLLHLDLKPRNVFVLSGEPEQIKVIDFGISQHVGAAARSAAGLGPQSAAAAQRAPDLGATIATISSAADRSWMVSENGVQRARGGTLLYASPEQCKHLRGDPIIDELDGRSDLYSLGIMAFQLLTGGMPWTVRTQNEAFQAHLELPVPAMAKFGVKVPRGLEQFVVRCLAKNRDDRFADVKAAYEALDRVAHPPSQWPRFAAAGALVVGVTVWQMWPAGSQPEVTLPADTYFFGPQRTQVREQLGSLMQEVAKQPAGWVVDPQSEALALPGWQAGVEQEGELYYVRLEAPAAAAASIVDTQAYLHFGDGAAAQHTKAIRVVWLPPTACSIGAIGVRDAGDRVLDPVGARLAIEVRARRDHVDSVQVVLGDRVRNATLDEGRAGEALWFEVPLAEFGFAAADGLVTAPFEVVVRDRAGNEQRRPAPLRIDARPLSLDKASLDVPADRKDFYVLGPTVNPKLQVRPNRRADVTFVARDLDGKVIDVEREVVDDDFVLRFPPAGQSYEGTIEVVANDLATVFHADDNRGRAGATLGFRYETKAVTVGVAPRHADGSAPVAGSEADTFVTNRDAVTLELTREQVAVSVEVECRRDGGEPWRQQCNLYGENLQTLVVPLAADGRHEIVVSGYRYSGPYVPRTSEPEFRHTLYVVRDTHLPELVLDQSPAPIRGPVEAGATCCVVEVGDDSAAPIVLEWELSGPSAARRSCAIPAGPRRSVAVAWRDLTLDPQQLEDGDYSLQLTAVDLAGNRSAAVHSDAFVIAWRPPHLQLKSPDRSTWLATAGNLFQVVVEGIDNNGVEAVECVVRRADSGEALPAQTLRRSGNDPARGDWVAQIPLPEAWSQKDVQVCWHGRDRFGNTCAEQRFPTTLQAFEVQRQTVVWLEVADEGKAGQPMRLVRGDPNYVFGGRNDDDETYLLGSFGIEGARGKITRCSVEKCRVDDFYLDANEVTVREFGDFLAKGYDVDGHWTTRDGRGERGRPEATRLDELRRFVAGTTDGRLPMTGVDWYEAAAYAHWIGKRLPSKVEWEYAVRGGTAYRPFSCAVAGQAVPTMNVDRPATGPWNIDRGGDVTPAGRGDGIRNLCSNVMEWTNSPAVDPALMQAAGACFDDIAFHFRKMAPLPPTERRATLGFRCAADASAVDHMLEQSGRIRVLTNDPDKMSKDR